MRAVNLLPRDDVRQRRAGPPRQAQLLIAVPILAIALVGAGWLFTGAKVKDNRATLRALQSELDAIPNPKTGPRTDPQVAAQHDQRVSALADALSSRLAWDRVLRHISSVLPDDVWLTTLAAVTAPAVAPPPPTATATTTTTTDTSTTATTPAPVVVPPPVSSLEIDGYTYSHEAVARFMARLSVVPDLSDVSLTTSALAPIGKRTVVKFTLKVTIRQPGASS